jgi:hypothetical protein
MNSSFGHSQITMLPSSNLLPPKQYPTYMQILYGICLTNLFLCYIIDFRFSLFAEIQNKHLSVSLAENSACLKMISEVILYPSHQTNVVVEFIIVFTVAN